MHFDKNLFHMAVQKSKQKGFQISHFYWSFSSDDVAVKGLNICDCTNIFQPNSSYKASWWGALWSFRTDKCCCVQQHCRLLWLGASVVGRKVFTWLMLCHGNTTAHAAVITRDFLATARMDLVIAELLWESDQAFDAIAETWWAMVWSKSVWVDDKRWRGSHRSVKCWFGCLAGKSVHKSVTKQKPLICPFPLPSIDCNKWKHQTKAKASSDI